MGWVVFLQALLSSLQQAGFHRQHRKQRRVNLVEREPGVEVMLLFLEETVNLYLSSAGTPPLCEDPHVLSEDSLGLDKRLMRISEATVASSCCSGKVRWSVDFLHPYDAGVPMTSTGFCPMGNEDLDSNCILHLSWVLYQTSVFIWVPLLRLLGFRVGQCGEGPTILYTGIQDFIHIMHINIHYAYKYAPSLCTKHWINLAILMDN